MHAYAGDSDRCAQLADLTHNIPRLLCSRGWVETLEFYRIEHAGLAEDVDGAAIVQSAKSR